MVLKNNWPQYSKGTIKTRRLENEGHKIRICTKYYIFIPSCLYAKLKKEGHKIRICTKYYTFIPSCLYARLKKEGHKIRICTKYYTSIPSCLYARLRKEGHKIRICTKYYRENLSLGGTIRKITTQIFETQPTLEQHRAHIKKTFYFKLFI
jgi:rRNA-processing protein FCF1